MPRYTRVRAKQVRNVRPGFARLTLSDGNDAIAFTDLCGPLQTDDELLVNTCALDLQLGTGGAHIVHANLSASQRDTVDVDADFASDSDIAVHPGRVIKVRYLSEQLAVDAHEEAAGLTAVDTDPGMPPSLAGTRVALCVLHSHAMALAAAVKDATGEAPGYVMSDGGALPFVLSDLAATCLERGLIANAASAGHAFGAPIEAVTVPSAVAALAQRQITRVIVAPGPGHLGTGSPLGFSGLDLVGHAAVLDALGAATAVGARASSIDVRTRHSGVSHHTRTMAALAPTGTVVPVPVGATICLCASDAKWIETLGKRASAMSPIRIAEALGRLGLSVTSMGRAIEDDAQACDWLGATAAWLAASR